MDKTDQTNKILFDKAKELLVEHGTADDTPEHYLATVREMTVDHVIVITTGYTSEGHQTDIALADKGLPIVTGYGMLELFKDRFRQDCTCTCDDDD